MEEAKSEQTTFELIDFLITLVDEFLIKLTVCSS